VNFELKEQKCRHRASRAGDPPVQRRRSRFATRQAVTIPATTRIDAITAPDLNWTTDKATPYTLIPQA
jgi:hypothetical protein